MTLPFEIKKTSIVLISLLASTCFADDKGSKSLWDKIDSYGEKAIEQSSQLLENSENAISNIIEASKAEIKNLTAESEIDVQDKIDDIRLRLDELMSIKKKETLADSFTLFSKSKKDYRIEIDKVLEELEKVLFDGEIVNYSSKIRKAREEILDAKREVAELNEKKSFAKEQSGSIFKSSKSEIQEDINSAKQRIETLETRINALEFDLLQKLSKLGVRLNRDQIRVLTTRIDGDEVSKTFAIFDVTKQISNKLKELVKSNSYDSSYSVKYYGVYVALSEILGHAQRTHINRINDVYLPALSKVKSDITGSIEYAESNLGKVSSSNKPILRKNIESNKLAIQVAEKYEELLEQQKKQLEKAIKQTEEQITVAYSTYDTAANSANLVMLVDQSQAEFDRLVEMQLPEILPFESIELGEKFAEISQKLSTSINSE